MARKFISVLSDEQGVRQDRVYSSPEYKRFWRKKGNKARRSLDKIAIQEAVLDIETDMEDVFTYSIEDTIEELETTGAVNGCDCGCGGETLSDLYKAKRRGLPSLSALYEALAEEQKKAECEALWAKFSAGVQ